jgi:hypothetical protein
MKLDALQQWVCDTCGETIEEPEHGWIEWLTDEDMVAYGFRIVHHAPHSPRRSAGGRCQYGRGMMVADEALPSFIGADGLANFLSLLETNPLKDQQEFISLVRRLHIPHYEEARLYWSSAKDDGFFDGANELWPYLQETLLSIIDRYGPKA